VGVAQKRYSGNHKKEVEKRFKKTEEKTAKNRGRTENMHGYKRNMYEYKKGTRMAAKKRTARSPLRKESSYQLT